MWNTTNYSEKWDQGRDSEDLENKVKATIFWVSTCSVRAFTLHEFLYLILTILLKGGIIFPILTIRKLRVKKIKLLARDHTANILHSWDSNRRLDSRAQVFCYSTCLSVTTPFQFTLFPTNLKRLTFLGLIHILEKQS